MKNKLEKIKRIEPLLLGVVFLFLLGNCAALGSDTGQEPSSNISTVQTASSMPASSAYIAKEIKTLSNDDLYALHCKTLEALIQTGENVYLAQNRNYGDPEMVSRDVNSMAYLAFLAQKDMKSIDAEINTRGGLIKIMPLAELKKQRDTQASLPAIQEPASKKAQEALIKAYDTEIKLREQ